ncbi:MAG: HAMP domain-containing histidine kinase [Lachnospiraceae bacterium]|nr:HAMP domain-containing histidine kinase [Lachnospiraceae bacterium]
MKKRGLWNLWNYMVIFLMVAFLVTVNFLVFLHAADLTEEMIKGRAIATFFNVVAISLVLCIIDGIRRKYLVEKPVQLILEVTKRLSQGDFKARIENYPWGIGRDDFAQIAVNINRLAEELSTTETLKTDFISNVSHELKTPLAVIGNYSTMLQSENLSEEQRRTYAGAIEAQTGKLSELIGNILYLNKLEHQAISPKCAKFDLGEQLCECLVAYEHVWEEKQIELDTDIETAVEIDSDRELLSLVWNNLLSNALKFTEPGGTVSVSVRGGHDMAVVTIKDTGCGMDAETGRHMFDKFYQGDTSHATQGNGLGLALVKRVITILNAQIDVQSRRGEGTTIEVTIFG